MHIDNRIYYTFGAGHAIAANRGVTEVDLAQRTVSLDGTLDGAPRRVAFDSLVLALGATSSTHGIPGADDHTFALKTVEDAMALRSQIIRMLETAVSTADCDERRRAVIFGVADDETAARIVSRLSSDDFWTEAGLRTVPRDAPDYGPAHGYGLLGGVWVGVSFWFAFAAARFSPEFMAHALAASFRHYSRDPHRNKTVPGQFSQWLHGETLVNQGMTLSPWFPPRYLWAAIEGAGGLNSSGGSPSVTPRLASDWKWLGVRNVPYRDRTLTWFVVRTPELARYSNFRSGKRRHSSATTTTLANSSASFANSQLADSRAQLPEPGSTLPRHR